VPPVTSGAGCAGSAARVGCGDEFAGHEVGQQRRPLRLAAKMHIDRLDEPVEQPERQPDFRSWRTFLAIFGSKLRLILLPFQDEPNDATLSSWQDQEESMKGWLRRLDRLFGKHKTFESFGKHWRYFCQQS